MLFESRREPRASPEDLNEQRRGGRQMIHREPPRRNRVRKDESRAEAIDLLKEVFVCISIPVVAFALAYITLDTFVRLFLG